MQRESRTKIGDYTGPAFSLSAVVPQGSALSPTLYTTHTADLNYKQLIAQMYSRPMT